MPPAAAPVLALLALVAGAPPAGARIEGQVLDPSGKPVSGALVEIASPAGVPVSGTATDARGGFAFPGLAPGTYRVSARLGRPSEKPVVVRLRPGETRRLDLRVRLPPFEGALVVEEELPRAGQGQGAGGAARPVPSTPQDERLGALDLLPLATDRFQEALPLLPGVVRGPDGRLNFQGARASQSTLLVNGSTATDPLTGEFAFELPLKAVESVEVHAIPYSAEFGDVSAAVTSLTTRPAGEGWRFHLGSFVPSLRFRDGTVQGIKTATPRLRLSGPLIPDRLSLAQDVSYKFARSRAYGTFQPGDDEQVLESFDTLTQLDSVLGRHELSGAVAYYPLEIDAYGLDTLRAEAAAPELRSEGSNLGVVDRVRLGARTEAELRFARSRYDVEVEPHPGRPARLTPDGPRGSHFNRLDRVSDRRIAAASVSTVPAWGPGEHRVKAGIEAAHTSFHGTDRSQPVLFLDGAGGPVLEVGFTGASVLEARDLRLSAYVQDRWLPHPRLGLDLGLRLDRERLAPGVNLGPRLAGAFLPWAHGRTVLRAGFGLFHQQIPLHAECFESFQERTETYYDPAGEAAPRTLAFRNRIAPGGLRMPRGTAWSLEMDQQVPWSGLLRIAYRERHIGRQAVVHREEDGPGGPALVVRPDGRTETRELEVTARFPLGEDGALRLSYARSRSFGDLNAFGEVFGDLRSPLLLPDERSYEAHDVPHRFLAWARTELPAALELTSGLEWRSGFPYTLLDARYRVVGRRNGEARFPAFFSLDLQVARRLKMFGRRLKLGVQVWNATGHFNPRDVTSQLGSPRSGELRNSVPFSVGPHIELDW